MYTVDASVWVNAFDENEAGHAISRELLDLLDERQLPIIVPTLLLAELGGTISRTRQDPVQALALVEELCHLPHVTLIALDLSMAQHSATLAAQHRLRGADSTYAAVAADAGCILVTLDREHLTRLDSVVTVRTPAALLSELTLPHLDEDSGEGGEAGDS